MRGRVYTTFRRASVIRFPYLKVWGAVIMGLAVASSRHFCRLVISYWLSVWRVLGFLERLDRPHSILIGSIDAGSSVDSGMFPGRAGSEVDVPSHSRDGGLDCNYVVG